MKQRCRIAMVAGLVLVGSAARADDWPAYRHDNYRSGKTAEQINAAQLEEEWRYVAPHPPQPAWPGPARWDAYRHMHNLPSLRNYDPVFHMIVVDEQLYFGSSVDDAVHCLDTNTGEQLWQFTTDGPVRVAPTWSQGKLYFGSDDGHAYCIKDDGSRLVWKFRPANRQKLVLNDGRLISFWPCRTGVLVVGRSAYFAMSMLPWKESYLCAVGVETGQPEGEGRYVQRLEEQITFEGPMLASASRLILPQGRVAPRMFHRSNGEPAGQLGYTGAGCFVLMTPDEHVFHGPGRRGTMLDTDAKDPTKIATVPGGRGMVVVGKDAYIMTERNIIARRRGSNETLWKVDEDELYTIIVAGNTLFAGARDRVKAFDRETGEALWEGKVQGRAQGLVVADGALFVSTDEGGIYCFRSGDAKRGTRAEAKDGEPADAPAAVAAKPQSARPRIQLASGPFLEFTGRDSAVVRWETLEPSPTILRYGLKDLKQRFSDETPTTQHEAVLNGLRKNRIYRYAISAKADGKVGDTGHYECDTHLNFSTPAMPDLPSPYPVDELSNIYQQAAEQILEASGVRRGICLVLGGEKGRLAYELARRSQLRVIALETDEEKIAEARSALQAAKLYGARVQVLPIEGFRRLPIPGQFASLIVSDRLLARGEMPGRAAEVHHLLRPAGGVAYLGQPAGSPNPVSRAALTNWLKQDQVEHALKADDSGRWVKLTRGALPGSGEWSHQYGTAANAAYGGETLRDSTEAADLEVQWVGRPGPRYQPDRSGRKPAPLSTGGRLFAQGYRRVVAMDAYNGAILWSKEIPDLGRFNIPRDCGNWCADDDFVYVAVRDRCLQLDAASGRTLRSHRVVPGPNKWKYDWSYIAQSGNRIVGSGVREGTAFTDFWGGKTNGWYDAVAGPVTEKVCSDNLFALDKKSGATSWVYTDGLVINSTITIGDGHVYFIESRNEALKTIDKRRLGGEALWKEQFLVALDVETGKKLWQRPLDIPSGTVMISMAYADGKLVVVPAAMMACSVIAFRADDGQRLWTGEVVWERRDHGGHMGRPAIVGNKVYVRPGAFDLANGARLAEQVPGGGCGTYAASQAAIFFRAGNVTMWDPLTSKSSGWDRLRPGCWLSTIPASGMLLSPEAGGGCSCSIWLETSVGFMPVTDVPRIVTKARDFVGSLNVQMQNLMDGGEIRYTLDDSEPQADSPLYTQPIRLTGTATIQAALFAKGVRRGDVRTATFKRLEGREPTLAKTNEAGLRVEYYEGVWQKLPDFSKLTPLATGSTTSIDLKFAQREDNFALRFTGYLSVPKGGLYEFFTNSDDGSSLTIGDEKVVDNDGLHPPVVVQGRIALAAGKHPITIEFLENGGGEALQVYYQGPGIARGPLPASALSH